MVEITTLPCSFCGSPATDVRSGESDVFNTCAKCGEAWDADPEFASERHRLGIKEKLALLVKHLNSVDEDEAAALVQASSDTIEQLTTDLDTVVRALETASKRLNTIALVRFAADKFDPYDLPKVETLRTWAEHAREALSNIKREGVASE